MRRVLIGVVIGAVLALAGWAYGHQRYGELLNEWRWRYQLKGVKVTQAPTPRPASALLFPLAERIAVSAKGGKYDAVAPLAPGRAAQRDHRPLAAGDLLLAQRS
jgi:hypothetical protein